MSKKRRVFDIDFDAVETPETTAKSEARRGPMAAAITENAQALNTRQEAEAAIRAENDALAHEHVRLKKAGLITDLIPLELVRTDKLTRDRADGRDPEIDELKLSIRDIGLSNPIRVEAVDDHYELIQGFRRFTAYRELFAETKDDTFARIPAGINARGENTLRLYRRMVDENLVRRGVSFGEMAQLALNYHVQDPNVESYDQAVELLYASAGRQKRSYIKHFVRLLVILGDELRHAEALPRAAGLALVKRLDGNASECARLTEMLGQTPGRDAREEQAILSRYLATRPVGGRKSAKGPAVRKAKTTFRLTRPEGDAKCTVSDGRVEVQLNRDFSGVERKKLEGAVAAFLAALEE